MSTSPDRPAATVTGLRARLRAALAGRPSGLHVGGESRLLEPTMPMTEEAVSVRKPRDDEIDVYGLTHPGKVRTTNNDHFLIGQVRKHLAVSLTSMSDLDQATIGQDRLAFVAMVADGVGGGERGQEASRLALQAVTEYMASSMDAYYSSDARESAAFTEVLEEAALRCHAEVLKRAEERPEFRGMATTLTLWFGVWPWYYILQVGDSRYYLYREGVLTQISRDQTMAEALLAQGGFQRGPGFMDKWSHVLASSIGGTATAPVVTRLRHDWKNTHLLCSDGLTKHVSDARIAERLRDMTSAKQVCEALLQDALDGGGSDNITIVVGRSTPHDPAAP
ncbi:MAG TPA: protein phosphatase 2C domain-containing protein [Gemmatimonadales bacterium]|nr:protein phosphatase 2C domain-containing protein [Gemmatimonadales bacterium]